MARPLGSQSEGANPAILSNDYDPYLRPGRHAPADLVIHPEVRLRRDLFASPPLTHAAAGAQARAGAGSALCARAKGVPRRGPHYTQLRARCRHRRLIDLLWCLPRSMQVPEPHPDIGDWWTLYDYGLDAVRKWPKECALRRALFAKGSSAYSFSIVATSIRTRRRCAVTRRKLRSRRRRLRVASVAPPLCPAQGCVITAAQRFPPLTLCACR